MLFRSNCLVISVFILLSDRLSAQSSAWKVTDVKAGAAVARISLSTNDLGPDDLTARMRLIKVESSTPMFVNISTSPGTGVAGNWLRFAQAASASTDCSKVTYISYPSLISTATPVFVCLSALRGLPHGYYGAFLRFTPSSSTAARFSLPVQLNAFPSGYLQLGSDLGQGDLSNDAAFTYAVANGIADPSKPVYATVSDANGFIGDGTPITYDVRDDTGNAAPWVTVTTFDKSGTPILQNPKSPVLFRIGINPSQLPSGQPDLNARVRINSGGQLQGECSVFIKANVSLPPPTLSTGGVRMINLSYPNGFPQQLDVQSSGSPISFTAKATSDDNSGWLIVNPTSGSTPAQLTVSATVSPSRAPNTYTGSIVITPTDVSIPAVTVSVTLQVNPAPPGPITAITNLYFVPVPPCHVIDTRSGQGTAGDFGPPAMSAGQTRTFQLSQGACPGIPATAKAYSLSVTAAPTVSPGYLGFLTVWPTGQAQPSVSTLNGPRGGSVSNAAIVPAGINGGINVFATDPVQLMVDVNGYFDSTPSPTAYAFYPLVPCRVADTRAAPGMFGGPQMPGGASRDFPIGLSSCLPVDALPKS